MVNKFIPDPHALHVLLNSRTYLIQALDHLIPKLLRGD